MSQKTAQETTFAAADWLLDACRAIVFGSKWLLLPVFIGLIVVQGMYSFAIVQEIYHLLTISRTMTDAEKMLAVLTAVDMAMIAFMVRVILSGSWHAFVDKDGPKHEHISSGYLKVKMSMSLIGISGVHLIQTFLNIEHAQLIDWIAKIAIHLTFIVSTIGLAIVEQMHEKTEILRERSARETKGEVQNAKH